jgi:hypothetical protein
LLGDAPDWSSSIFGSRGPSSFFWISVSTSVAGMSWIEVSLSGAQV